MRLITRPALKRLSVLFGLIVVLVAGTWWFMIRMPSKSFRGLLPALTADQTALRDELRAHVEMLAGTIGRRHIFQPVTIKAAEHYIEKTFTNAGFTAQRQTYVASGEQCHNFEVEIRGTTKPDEIVVIGAHYDTEASNNTPGADDNASGTAAVLTLVKSPALQEPARTLRFVAFVNEEPPFFYTTNQGSYVYAKRCRERGENVVAMMSIESIGFYETRKGSQKYPFPMGLFYPNTADFIAFVSRSKDAGVVRRCIRSFRERAQFPSEGGALPAALPGISWSDHWSFWQAGYPALMVTDTTLFRSPHYHQETDTPDTLDFDRMARVVDGLEKVIAELVNGE